MKRIVNIKLLKSYHKKECIVCGTRQDVAGHHVISRGARGHDVEENIMALCFMHHRAVHDVGLTFFVEVNNLEWWMEKYGWEFEEFRNKWINPSVRYS